MILRLVLLLAVLAAAAAFTPGALPALEELLGLSGPALLPMPGAGGSTERKSGSLPVARASTEPLARAASDRADPTTDDAAHAAPAEPAPPAEPELPPLDAGSTLGVLTRVQAHAERSGVICQTIETTSHHGEAGSQPRADARWHLAGHGEPGPIVAFVAALESDAELCTLQSVGLDPHDAQRLAFSIELDVPAPTETR